MPTNPFVPPKEVGFSHPGPPVNTLRDLGRFVREAIPNAVAMPVHLAREGHWAGATAVTLFAAIYIACLPIMALWCFARILVASLSRT
jgi:hypothetical protein